MRDGHYQIFDEIYDFVMLTWWIVIGLGKHHDDYHHDDAVAVAVASALALASLSVTNGARGLVSLCQSEQKDQE